MMELIKTLNWLSNPKINNALFIIILLQINEYAFSSFRFYRKTKLSGFQDMECIPCGDPPPPYEPRCKHIYLLLLKANILESILIREGKKSSAFNSSGKNISAIDHSYSWFECFLKGCLVQFLMWSYYSLYSYLE